MTTERTAADKRPLYPVDPWRIRELTFDPALAARNETIFALANGHVGLRGNLDEDAGNVGPARTSTASSRRRRSLRRGGRTGSPAITR